jgi:hypothetical protein
VAELTLGGAVVAVAELTLGGAVVAVAELTLGGGAALAETVEGTAVAFVQCVFAARADRRAKSAQRVARNKKSRSIKDMYVWRGPAI